MRRAARRRARKLPLVRRFLSARGRSLEITRSGWLFIGLTLLVGFAAINTGSNLLHAIFGGMLALIVGSGILSEATVRRVVARRLPDGDVHAGTPAPIRVIIDNTDGRSDALSVSVEDDDRLEHDGRCDPVFAVRVPPARSAHLTALATMSRRGLQELPRAVVATRFPFGLFVKRRELGPPAQVLVLPRVHEVALGLPPLDRAPRGDSGGQLARDGEFFGLREYREGDELRRIHWRAVARLGRPIVREHEAAGAREIVLELGRGRTGDPAFEHAVEEVASVAVARLRDGLAAVGLRYDDDEIVAPGVGPAHARWILSELATVGDP